MSIAEAIRNEAAKETLKVCKIYRENMRLKHGLEADADDVNLPEDTPVEQPSPQGSGSTVSAEKPGVSRAIKVAAVVAGLLGTGGLGTAAGMAINSWLNPKTESERTIEQRGSVLPYLEEGGYHLPPVK